MRDYLIFHLYGPMQSWGEIAVGEARATAAHPTKSAIIGLLAAALGLRRERTNDAEHQALFDSLYFAVRVDSPGVLLRDYHTAQIPPARRNVTHATRKAELTKRSQENLGTVLSSRDYRCDAIYTVALWAKTKFDLNRLRDALLSPVFTLSLGRKSCPPALPLQPIIRTGTDLADALARIPYPALLKQLLPLANSQVDIHWEGEDPLNAAHRNQRRDGLISRSRWQFADRNEFYATIAIPSVEPDRKSDREED